MENIGGCGDVRKCLYLQHHHTDLFDTLDDGLGGPRDGHGSLCGVWQHVSCNLDLSTCGLKAGEAKQVTCIPF